MRHRTGLEIASPFAVQKNMKRNGAPSLQTRTLTTFLIVFLWPLNDSKNRILRVSCGKRYKNRHFRRWSEKRKLWPWKHYRNRCFMGFILFFCDPESCVFKFLHIQKALFRLIRDPASGCETPGQKEVKLDRLLTSVWTTSYLCKWVFEPWTAASRLLLAILGFHGRSPKPPKQR